MCIDTVNICFGIADGQISSILDSYMPAIGPLFHFWTVTLVNINVFHQMCIDFFGDLLWNCSLANFVNF